LYNFFNSNTVKLNTQKDNPDPPKAHGSLPQALQAHF